MFAPRTNLFEMANIWTVGLLAGSRDGFEFAGHRVAGFFERIDRSRVINDMSRLWRKKKKKNKTKMAVAPRTKGTKEVRADQHGQKRSHNNGKSINDTVKRQSQQQHQQ